MVKPRVNLLALAIPYSGNPKIRYDTVFSLGPFNMNKSPFCYPFWGCWQGYCLHCPFRTPGTLMNNLVMLFSLALLT